MDGQTIQQILQKLPGLNGQLIDYKAVSGGDINQAFKVCTSKGSIFLKLNHARFGTMFETEAESLKRITLTKTIQTPEVIGHGVSGSKSFLALEWREATEPNRNTWQLLGEQLAQLHLVEAGETFGWPSDNFIGSNPQHNQQHECWAHFFAQQRIRPQLEWLNIHLYTPIEKLTDAIEQELASHHPRVSLVHGDLWAGNVMFDKRGPLLIDPACYLGDAYTDLAMTRLFGDYPSGFYQAYKSNFGSCGERWHELYNLYHLLNHANLFGGHYVQQSLSQLKRYL